MHVSSLIFTIIKLAIYMFSIYIYICICILFVSCTNEFNIVEVEPDYTLNDFKEKKVELNKIKLLTNQRIKEFEISDNKNLLIIINNNNSNPISLYDLSSFENLFNYNTNRVDEVIYTYRNRYDKQVDKYYSFIFYQNKLNIFSIYRDGIKLDSLKLIHKSIDPIINRYNNILIDNNFYNPRKYKYLFNINDNSKSIEYKGHIYNPSKETKDSIGIYFSNSFYLLQSSDNDNFINIYTKLPLIEIYDKDLILIKRVIGPDGVFFEDKRVETEINEFRYTSYLNRKYYFNQNIYYSNQSTFIGINDEYLDSTFNKIVQYDENFNPKYIYKLPLNISSFRVHKKDNKIYCLFKNEIDEILYFNF